MSKLKLKPQERIIVALDIPEHSEATAVAKKVISSGIGTFKIGPVLFLNSGPAGLSEFRELGADIFLDLKFHDIPSTVEKSIPHVLDYGIKMFTIHSLGGYEMMEAVCQAVSYGSLEQERPLVLAVTVLTSHDDESLNRLGLPGTTEDSTLRLASIADKAGVDGLICSGLEVSMLREEFGDRFVLVVPGIRPGTPTHDQKRVTTPAQAVANGADYLVIGRAVTQSKEPEKVIGEIVRSLTDL